MKLVNYMLHDKRLHSTRLSVEDMCPLLNGNEASLQAVPHNMKSRIKDTLQSLPVNEDNYSIHLNFVKSNVWKAISRK